MDKYEVQESKRPIYNGKWSARNTNRDLLKNTLQNRVNLNFHSV